MVLDDIRDDVGPDGASQGPEPDGDDGSGDGESGDPIPDYASKYQPEDPESKYDDPAEELPSIPEPPSPDPEEIPDGLRLSFWWLVLVFNGALLALWLGVLFVAFEGNLDLGGRLLFAGSVLFVYGYYKYRTNPYR
ncbi:hypothetical protein BRD00_15315 [Halobacteriales archaeon QS_8_69_26]|nr:MAG: hypothetical protein BRD00_15315 [Halobacteriales archaeon QS_8_69_26]